jgi:hypothetical protein
MELNTTVIIFSLVPNLQTLMSKGQFLLISKLKILGDKIIVHFFKNFDICIKIAENLEAKLNFVTIYIF